MKIIFPISVYQKLRAYVDNTRYEISGLGKISRKDDVITVEDVRIFHQKVSSAETVLNHKELAAFYDEIIKEEGDLSQWKLWWHSHATFDTFFSGVDKATIEDFDSEMVEDNWMLSIVVNHKADLLARLDVFYPLRITLNDLDWDISYEDRQIKLGVLDEIAEKVVPGVIYRETQEEIDFKNKRRVLANRHLLFNPDGTLRKVPGSDFSMLNTEELNILFPTFEDETHVEEADIVS